MERGRLTGDVHPVVRMRCGPAISARTLRQDTLHLSAPLARNCRARTGSAAGRPSCAISPVCAAPYPPVSRPEGGDRPETRLHAVVWLVVAAVEHSGRGSCRPECRPGAVLADQQIDSAKCQVRGSSSLREPLLHHVTAFTATPLATAAVRAAVVITRIRVEWVLSGRGCRPRTCHQHQQDRKPGERQISVHRFCVPTSRDYDPRPHR